MNNQLKNIIKLEITAKNVPTSLYILCNTSMSIVTNEEYNKNLLGEKILQFLETKTDDFWIFYKNKTYPKTTLKKFIKDSIKYTIKSVTRPTIYTNIPTNVYDTNMEDRYFVDTNIKNTYRQIIEKIERKYAKSNINLSVLRKCRSEKNVFIIDNFLIHASLPNIRGHLNYLRDDRKYIVINPKLLTITDSCCNYGNIHNNNNINVIDTITALNLINLTENKVLKMLEKYNKHFSNKQKPDLILLGLGGVGNSFIYWLDNLIKHFEMTEPMFNNLVLVDGDDIEYHNLYRLPLWNDDLELNNNQTLSKIDMTLKSYTNKISKKIISYNKFINSKEDLEEILQHCNTPIIYGAPTIETRQMLYKIQQENTLNFTLAYCLNQNNIASLEYNPDYSENMALANETYGTLNVSVFLLNQLAIVCKFIENLTNNTQENIQIDMLSSNASNYFVKQIKGEKYYI